jgi:hypothetical protein
VHYVRDDPVGRASLFQNDFISEKQVSRPGDQEDRGVNPRRVQRPGVGGNLRLGKAPRSGLPFHRVSQYASSRDLLGMAQHIVNQAPYGFDRLKHLGGKLSRPFWGRKLPRVQCRNRPPIEVCLPPLRDPHEFRHDAPQQRPPDILDYFNPPVCLTCFDQFAGNLADQRAPHIYRAPGERVAQLTS